MEAFMGVRESHRAVAGVSKAVTFASLHLFSSTSHRKVQVRNVTAMQKAQNPLAQQHSVRGFDRPLPASELASSTLVATDHRNILSHSCEYMIL